MLEKIILVICGALLASLGYLFKRSFEQRPAMERIEKQERLLTLKTKLEESNITLDDLAKFEDLLLGKAKAAADISISYEEQAESISRSIAQDGLTQADMNQIAVRNLHLADKELDEIVDQLAERLSEHELDRFMHAHSSWNDYRERYAQFVADQYHGGSIQPLVHASTLETITSARIAELKLELEDRRL
jgi:uncharacterized protein YecT (DUF1311 family)